ncbi:MAG: right-handed parallel beta-helix repeat-containing protein, partial [Candidatus Omnitrophica bacterium]|nr:right-handed parallel beta-helix repeat-containing protein [Candidatus Omnitrophota bacterium]
MHKKIVSIMILASMVCAGISDAFETKPSGVALPTKFGSLVFRHASEIELEIRHLLKEFSSIDLATLRSLGEKSVSRRRLFSEEIAGYVFFNRAEDFKAPAHTRYAGRKNYLVRATVDGMHYICLISEKESGGYEISILPHEKYASSPLYPDSTKKNSQGSSFLKYLIGAFMAACALHMQAADISPSTALNPDDISLPAGNVMQVFPEGANAVVSQGAIINMKDYSVAIGSGTDQLYEGGRLIAETINGRRHVYVGFATVGKTSISSAMDIAPAGSIILVKAGIYTEDITIKNGISLYGGYDETGLRNITANETVINGTILANGITEPTEVNGFTIKVANNRKAVVIISSNPELKVLNNKIEGAAGADVHDSYNIGIWAEDSEAIIFNNSISNCHWFGLYSKLSSLTVENNIIRSIYRDGVQEIGGTSSYRNNFFWDSGLMENSGSSFLLYASNPLIESNTFYRERTGIFAWDSAPFITNNIFELIADHIDIQGNGSPREGGNLDDPDGAMGLGIDPATGQYHSATYPDKGYSPSFIRKDYNAIITEGITIDYVTGIGAAAWAGGGFSYDLAGTLQTIESVDLSANDEIIVGIQGDATRVKMELKDFNGNSKSVYLSPVASTAERLWSVSKSLLNGVDLRRIRYIFFIVEGENLQGRISIHGATAFNLTYNVLPNEGLTTNDINAIASSMMIAMNSPGSSVSVTNLGSVFRMDYTTGPDASAWAEAGFSYDHLGTTNTVETIDITGIENLLIGLRGDAECVKLEVENESGDRAIVYLTGVTSTEKIWSIPASVLKAADLSRVRFMTFVVEGANKTGSVYVRFAADRAFVPNIPPAGNLGTNDINLATADTAFALFPQGASAVVSNTAEGIRVDYTTGTQSASWAGGMFSYDHPANTGAVESVDLSGLGRFIIGASGSPNRIKMEVKDKTGKCASVYLTDVSSQKKIWSCDFEFLKNIDLKHVAGVSFIVEGENLSGSFFIHTKANSQLVPYIPPSAGLDTGDVNLHTTYTIGLPRATTVETPTGITITYATGSGADAWAGGGFSYDNFGT